MSDIFHTEASWTFLWSKPEIRLHPYLSRTVLTHFPTLIIFPKLHPPHQASLPFGLSLTGQMVSTPGLLEVLCSVAETLSFIESVSLFLFHPSTLSWIVPQRVSSPCSEYCHKCISPCSSLVQHSIFSFSTLEHDTYFFCHCFTCFHLPVLFPARTSDLSFLTDASWHSTYLLSRYSITICSINEWT